MSGGAGMIGSHLVDVLLHNLDADIYVLDNFSVGKRLNVSTASNVHVIDCDVCDKEKMDALISSVDVVYHLATVKKGSDSDAAIRTLDVIVDSARIVLESCTLHEKRLVLASTSDVYGYGTQLPFRETDPVSLGPFNTRRWNYAVAKLFTEQLAHEYIRKGLDARIIRYFGGFSERSSFTWSGGHVPIFAHRAYHNLDIEIHGDGLQTRCVTYGEDLANGTYLAGTKSGISGELFNIGSEEEMTVLEAAERILKAIPQSSSKIVHVETDTVYGNYREIPRRRPCLDKAKKLLGYCPKYNFDQGLEILLRALHDGKNK